MHAQSLCPCSATPASNVGCLPLGLEFEKWLDPLKWFYRKYLQTTNEVCQIIFTEKIGKILNQNILDNHHDISEDKIVLDQKIIIQWMYSKFHITVMDTCDVVHKDKDFLSILFIWFFIVYMIFHYLYDFSLFIWFFININSHYIMIVYPTRVSKWPPEYWEHVSTLRNLLIFQWVISAFVVLIHLIFARSSNSRAWFIQIRIIKPVTTFNQFFQLEHSLLIERGSTATYNHISLRTTLCDFIHVVLI